jgi:copper homeostasis protein
MSADLFRALEDVCMTGAERLLTSGGEQDCLRGMETVAGLVKAARGRVTIMAGGGIGLNNAARIIERTGVTDIHVGLASPGREPPAPSERASVAGQDARP